MILALVDLSPWLQFTLQAAAVLFACGAGYTFGWVVPHWADDSSLEDSGLRGTRHYGSPYYHQRGCLLTGLVLGRGFTTARPRTFAPIILGVLTVACIAVAWDLPEGALEEYGDFFLLFHKPIWLTLAAAFAGYFFARVSDKGPVGPLE